MFEIQFLNKSTLISDAQLKPIVAVLQKQVDEHFSPAYYVTAKIQLTKSDNGTIPIHIVDTAANAPKNALGWHTTDDQRRPYGIIPMKAVLHDGEDAGSTISHELLELLADPTCSLSMLTTWPAHSKKMASISYEVCDPVENDGYEIKVKNKTVKVSNFILPAWFVRQSKGPWDHLNTLRAHGPLKMTSGGYLQWQHTGSHGHTVEKAAQIRPFRAKPHYHSRVMRRMRHIQELRFPGHHEMVREAEAKLRRHGADPEALNALAVKLMGTLGRDSTKSVESFVTKLLKKD